MHLYALMIGFTLDVLVGDPRKWPHLVVAIGRTITWSEHLLRRSFPKTSKGEIAGGVVLAILVPGVWCLAAFGLLYLCVLIHPLLGLAVESILCWQCLAMRSLRDESMAVYKELEKGDIKAARQAVSWIVGRDTEELDEAGVTRAAVETVAENASDGVIAPMLFMAIGGAPLGIFYKAINTLDSMVGYKNSLYLFFGRASAKIDDVANFIPSRLAGLLMVGSAFFAGEDVRKSWKIFWRDRLNHKSPNSAHTEAACAGALHIRLGGDARYFGRLVHKSTIGDNDRPIEPEDIRRSNRLMIVSSILCLTLVILGKVLVIWL
jgi:adenosylcobinamide-phosphate synthase